jgi:hypothetical protein
MKNEKWKICFFFGSLSTSRSASGSLLLPDCRLPLALSVLSKKGRDATMTRLSFLMSFSLILT